MPPKTLDSTSPSGKPRILSLDGGGFRGLGQLYALDAIMKAANTRNRTPADPQLKPHDIFELVIGASAGSIVAMLVGRLGLDCDTAIQEYKTLALALFGTNRDDFVRSVLASTQLNDTAYVAALRALITNRSPASAGFYPNPANTAKTAISIYPQGRLVGQSVPSFEGPGGLWRMDNLIRAATAAPRYLSPFEPPESEVKFIDAAYGSQAINPTALAIQRKYIDPANVGVLVNIGQGFRDVTIPNKTNLQKADTTPYQSTFLGGVTDTNKKVEDTVLFYLKQVQHAHKAWEDKLSQDKAFASGTLSRLDPPSVPTDRILDLADIFYADQIKASVEKWAVDNNAAILELVQKLVKADELTPKPDPTRIPYNPALDAKKPTEMLSYLSTYHVIFVVDDSTSMILKDDYSNWDENRWNQAQQAIGPIAQFAFDKQVKNIDMGFMHYQRNNPVIGLQSRAAVEATFARAKPPRDWNNIQYTPTGATLDYYLTKALDELDQKANTDREAYKKIRPTDIILLTDGEANDDPKSVMQRARKRMDAGRHNHNYIGIQIVQIGNSKSTAIKLEDITRGDCGDMADLVPSNGQDLTSEKLTRILLGGIHPSVRRELRKDEI